MPVLALDNSISIRKISPSVDLLHGFFLMANIRSSSWMKATVELLCCCCCVPGLRRARHRPQGHHHQSRVHVGSQGRAPGQGPGHQRSGCTDPRRHSAGGADRTCRVAQSVANIRASGLPSERTSNTGCWFGFVRSSIGVELLKKMGWKEGQGVGPRVKRRARRQQPGT